MKNNLLITFLFCVAIIINSEAFAEENFPSTQIFKFVPYRKIKAKIGSQSQNRISIEGTIIKEVIGDDKLYQVIYPTYRNHIFILPKSDSIGPINISIITENNLVQDMSLEIVREFGKTIILRFIND